MTSRDLGPIDHLEMAKVEEGMKLIGAWWSPYTLRARVALNMKKQSYEFLEETFGEKSGLLLKSNPIYKRIPVLLHGDSRIVCESAIIVEYVDAICAGTFASIISADAYQRATAQFWTLYLEQKWYPFLLPIGKAKTNDERKALIGDLQAATVPLEGVFARTSEGKGFFGGDRIGYLDITFGCYLGIVNATEKVIGVELIDEVKTPLLAGWSCRFCAEEAVKDVMPKTDDLIEWSKTLEGE